MPLYPTHWLLQGEHDPQRIDQQNRWADFSRQIILLYRERIDGLLARHPHVQEVSLLGSFGRGDASRESDMDPWVITDDDLMLEDMAIISADELSIRRSIAAELDLPNLARHLASLFSQGEAALYRRAFLSRVEVPRCHGAHSVIAQRVGNASAVTFSKHQLVLDSAVSIGEFSEQLSSALQRGKTAEPLQKKWSRRIIQLIDFLEKGEWIARDHGLDRILVQHFSGRPEAVVQSAERYLQSVRQALNNDAWERRTLSHKLLWNIEKVRWEVFQGMVDEAHFDRWRQGQGRFFGFPPKQISALADRVHLALGEGIGLAPLQERLVTLQTGECSRDHIGSFHDSWRYWLQANASRLLEEI